MGHFALSKSVSKLITYRFDNKLPLIKLDAMVLFYIYCYWYYCTWNSLLNNPQKHPSKVKILPQSLLPGIPDFYLYQWNAKTLGMWGIRSIYFWSVCLRSRKGHRGPI